MKILFKKVIELFDNHTISYILILFLIGLVFQSGVISCTDIERRNPLDAEGDAFDAAKADTIRAQLSVSSAAFSSAFVAPAIDSNVSSELLYSSGEEFVSSHSEVNGTIVKLPFSIVSSNPSLVSMSEDGVPKAFQLELLTQGGVDSVVQWTIIDPPQHGTARVESSDSVAVIWYEPVSNYHGNDYFLVGAQKWGESDSIAVIVFIDSVNDVPVITQEPVINGDGIQGEVLSLDSSVQCADKDRNGMYAPEVVWISDTDGVVGEGVVLSSYRAYQYLVHPENAGSYVYAIVRCKDQEHTIQRESNAIAIQTVPLSVLYFNGDDNFVTLPDISLDLSEGFSIELWMRWDDTLGHNAHVIELGTGQSNIVAIANYQSSNDLQFLTHNGTWSWVTIPDFIEVGQWTHLAVTVQLSGAVLVYKNGRLVHAGSVLYPTAIERTTNYLGKSSFEGDALFKGALDDVRVWSRVRSQGEIAANRFSERELNAVGLAAHWQLNGSQGSVIWDNTTSQYDGVYTGRLDGAWESPFHIYTLSTAQTHSAVVPTEPISVVEGEGVRVVAVPDSGYYFGGWISAEGSGEVHFENAAAETTTVYLRGGSVVIEPQITAVPHNALEFDGDDDYVSIGDMQAFGVISIEAWVYWSGVQNNERVIEFSNGPFMHNIIVARLGESATLQFSIQNSGSGVAEETDWYVVSVDDYIVEGEWIHVAVTASLDTMKIYKNGELLVAEGNKSGPVQVGRIKNFIGKSSFDVDALFKGRIDDVRIWSKVRTAEEILNERFNTLVGVDEGLVSHWNCNQPQLGNREQPFTDSLLYDSGTGEFHGTIFGNPSWVISEWGI